MRKINEIIVHCSGTRGDRDFTINDIDRWHREIGWDGCGYHYVVHRDGSIHAGRAEDVVGAHAYGHNSNSIGVCYIGGLNVNGDPEDTRTPAQKKSLKYLLGYLKFKYVGAKLIGHCDVSSKACPCFNASVEYSNL